MRYIGERNMNRANVVFTPDDKSTTDDDTELLNGIYRSDFKDNDGQIALDPAIMKRPFVVWAHLRYPPGL